MPFIDLLTGAGLDYVDTGGDGVPVVLLHGMLGTGETHFAGLIDWLRPHYRVLAPTLRGYGESIPKPRTFPRDFYQRDADDVLAFLDALGLETVYLLGYSDGGEVALCAAATAPERFHGVVTWGAVGYFGPDLRPAVQSFFPATWMTEDDKARHYIDNPDGFAVKWIKGMHRYIDSGGDVSYSRAPGITTPLLMLLGESDALNPVTYGQAYVAQCPDARLQTFPCGHAIHDEMPDAFRAVVRDFLGLSDVA